MGSLTTEPDSSYENVMVKLEAWQAERSWWHWEVEVAEAITNKQQQLHNSTPKTHKGLIDMSGDRRSPQAIWRCHFIVVPPKKIKICNKSHHQGYLISEAPIWRTVSPIPTLEETYSASFLIQGMNAVPFKCHCHFINP